jgi:LacI family transcriptional regulator
MTLTIVKDEDELEAYRGFSERGAVDGVIVQAPKCNDRRIPYLAELGIPFIVHGRASGVTIPYAWLDVDNRGAMRLATEHLLELGHRRIALVNGLETLDFAVSRREGYRTALEAAGLAADRGLMRSSDMSEPNGHAAAAAMLALEDPPTAFIASSMVLAMGIKRALDEAGLHMGREVSVLCYDDDLSYLPNTGDRPLFTALRSSVRAAGARCASLLIERIGSPQTPLPNELWEAELIPGRSTGPLST